MINNWNDNVQVGDRVYHLGDIFLCDEVRANKILDRLNGQIYLVRGNHDKTADRIRHRKLVWIKDYFKLKVDDKDASRGVQEICMLHYAMRVWDKSHHGAFHAYGHSHGSLPDDPNARSCDVGVDATAWRLAGDPEGKNPSLWKPEDYRPLLYDEYKKLMLQKNWKPIDHHTGERN